MAKLKIIPESPKASEDPFRLPPLDAGQTKTIYIDFYDEGQIKALREKGYIALDVRTMKRESPAQHRKAINAWLQGMSEGTINLDKERRQTLELEATLYGMKVTKSVRIDSKDISKESLESLLEIGRSKSKYGTVKPITDKDLEAAQTAGINPNKQLKTQSSLDKELAMRKSKLKALKKAKNKVSTKDGDKAH